MSEPTSISAGIAARYAAAIFDIAQEAGARDALEANIADLRAALAESDDLRTLISSPLYSRAEQQGAITAIAQKMDLMPALANALALMASKRRLFVVPQMLQRLADMIAEAKGEVTAEVTSAQPLSDAQSAALAQTLKEKVGRDVSISATVDESLIGGLVVKVGSTMIDSSIRARLDALQNAMKEVG